LPMFRSVRIYRKIYIEVQKYVAKKTLFNLEISVVLVKQACHVQVCPLSGNYCVLRNTYTIRALKQLVFSQDPNLNVLMETRRKEFEMYRLHNIGDLNSMIIVDCEGEGKRRASGLAVLWMSDINVQILSYSLNHVDIMISVGKENLWRATTLCGLPKSHRKHLACKLLHDLASLRSEDKWLAFGDLNLILSQDDKSGGVSSQVNCMDEFKKVIFDLNLVDLGFVGKWYTWSNK